MVEFLYLFQCSVVGGAETRRAKATVVLLSSVGPWLIGRRDDLGRLAGAFAIDVLVLGPTPCHHEGVQGRHKGCGGIMG